MAPITSSTSSQSRMSSGQIKPRSGRASASPPDADPKDAQDASASVSLETLVNHLLAAKRALHTMSLVLRGGEIATAARQLHEEAAILTAQSVFVATGVNTQRNLLRRIRRGMRITLDVSQKEFGTMVKALDASNAKLERAIGKLKNTTVEPNFRPDGEEKRNLLDFVDEKRVDRTRDSAKDGLQELQVRNFKPPHTKLV
jgi:autophagy-related protein 17